ncbi:sodium ion-translocating decarboxylase subunit beta, partial [Salmonella enterica subsp. enterica serovar Anatum]|nr:sodium ion-translocating decarboxylase subunit beta [Salmonella enterica subsp. enterica serovar Anatum]
EKERKIRMVQLRTVSKREKILFPVVLLLLVALLLPDAAPLLGAGVDNHAPDDPNHYAGQDQQYQPVTEGERALDDFILLFAEIA